MKFILNTSLFELLYDKLFSLQLNDKLHTHEFPI